VCVRLRERERERERERKKERERWRDSDEGFWKESFLVVQSLFFLNGTEISFGRPDEIRPKIVLF